MKKRIQLRKVIALTHLVETYDSSEICDKTGVSQSRRMRYQEFFLSWPSLERHLFDHHLWSIFQSSFTHTLQINSSTCIQSLILYSMNKILKITVVGYFSSKSISNNCHPASSFSFYLWCYQELLECKQSN